MSSEPSTRNTDIDELKARTPPEGALALGGRYVIKDLLGEGGMGSVYRVRDLELDEEVALKILNPSYADTPGALERFRREVKLARKVTHPNVARVYDFGLASGKRFLTMELVDGESLKVRAARKKLALPEILRIVGDVARGLAAAHAVGVVHRDLKPDNILIDSSALAQSGSERVVVTDFGIAALAENLGTNGTGSVVGTPEYMAPEQLEAHELDGRADVYALGITMFEMLVQRFPFDGKTPYAIAAARLVGEAVNVMTIDPSIPEPVGRLVADMLRRSRETRPDMLRVVDMVDVLRGAGRVAFGNANTVAPMSAPIAERAPLTIVISPFFAPDEPLRDAAAAICDSLGDTLSNVEGFTVVPAATLRRATAGALDVDPVALGREHDATLVIEGVVRAAPPRTRLRARIVDVSTGIQLWGDKFEAEAGTSVELEDEFTGPLVRAIRNVAKAIEVRTFHRHDGPSDPDARELYDQGVEASKEYGDHLERGIDALRRANSASPDDPYVMSALGAALVRSWSFNGNSALLGEAEDWSLRALATGTRIGQTFNTIGVLRLHQGELRAAIAAFREATARSPRLPEPHSYLGRLLSESGHFDDARQRLQRAVELDPGDHHALTELARIAAMAGQWDDANALLRTAAVGPAEGIVFASKARFSVWRKKPADLASAVADVESRKDDPGLRVVVKLVLPVWKALAAGEALAVDDARLAALHEAARGGSLRLTMFWNQLLAELHGVLGHDNAALRAIEAASKRALIDVAWLDHCPAIAHLREKARLSRARAMVAARAAALWL